MRRLQHDDDEEDFEEVQPIEEYDELQLGQFNRDEGHIYESISDELNLDEVMRELPDVEIDLGEESYGTGE